MASSIEREKQAAAEAGAALVSEGMRVGLGTGSTIARLLPVLAGRAVNEVVYVATSPETEQAAREHGLDVRPFTSFGRLDLGLDGADQIAPTGWLVKGGGGAHTREKVVAAAAARFVVIASSNKLVAALSPPIPLELLPFGLESTLRLLEPAALRSAPPTPDGGLLADYLAPVEDPDQLATRLSQTPGVVGHGLFPPHRGAAAMSDTYAWMAQRERRPPNPPRDLSHVWAGLTPLEQASGVVRARVAVFAADKRTTLATLERMGVRYGVTRHGGVQIAYAVRCAETEQLAAGTVVAVKFRDLDPDAPRVKFCAPGSRLACPALPTVYGAAKQRRVFVCEGESDAAWLLARCADEDAVFCLHGGAALFCREWIGHVPAADEVLIASDNDWDRRLGNIGDKLAQRFLAELPYARRLRPPFPAVDWCEVES
jgi:ribose 5-phosphate isomerase A